jgi:hypothetical protein
MKIVFPRFRFSRCSRVTSQPPTRPHNHTQQDIKHNSRDPFNSLIHLPTNSSSQPDINHLIDQHSNGINNTIPPHIPRQTLLQHPPRKAPRTQRGQRLWHNLPWWCLTRNRPSRALTTRSTSPNLRRVFESLDCAHRRATGRDQRSRTAPFPNPQKIGRC